MKNNSLLFTFVSFFSIFGLVIITLLIVKTPHKIANNQVQTDIFNLETQDPNADIILVNDFRNFPKLISLIKPLQKEWEKENLKVYYLDIQDIEILPGRDKAEKLRNKLVQQYQTRPFSYLWFIDLQKDSTHRIPARISLSSH